MGELDGQVAVITGASTGIGRAIATSLAQRGVRVALVARSPGRLDEVEAEIADAGGTARAIPTDVTDPAAVAGAVAVAREGFGPIDLAVHCAGTAEVIGPLWEADPDAWWAEVAVHTRGAANLAHAVMPEMIARGRGRVVNAYGNLGDRGGSYSSAYACGKAGLLRLTEHLDAETAPHGVRVFAFHPGLVETPMTRQLADGESGRRWLPRFSRIPADRWRSPEDAAALVAAIAQGDLDAYGGRLLGAGENLTAAAEPADADERTLRVIAPGSRSDRRKR